MVDVHLPDELWGQVCEHLAPRALSTISLTSQRFLAISRPMIYRHITIRVDDTSASTTSTNPPSVISVLDKYPELATSVRQLSIRVPNDTFVPGLTADFFRNLINLKHLSIVGSILVTSHREAADISQVVQTLPVERLHLQEHPSNSLALALNPPSTVIAHGRTSAVPNGAVALQSGDPGIAPLKSHALGAEMTQLLSYLPRTGFPYLSHLSLVNIDSQRLPDLLGFLAQCSHLEQLNLTFKPHRLTDPPIDFGEVLLQLNPESLPSLTSIGASSRFLNIAAQARLRSLASLDALIIQRDQFNGPRRFLSTLDSIRQFYTQYDFEVTATPIRPLRDLTVDFWVVNPSYPAMIIQECAELWGSSLITLRLPFSTFNMAGSWTPAWDELVSAITTFSKLKNVFFKRWVPTQSPRQDEAVVRFIKMLVDSMVKKNAKLSQIVFMEDDETVLESYCASVGWVRQPPLTEGGA